MAVSEAKKKANAKWNAENLEKIQFYAPKGFNQMINDRAKELGLSKAGYLVNKRCYTYRENRHCDTVDMCYI